MLGQMSIVRFQREKNGTWEVGLKVETDKTTKIFDENMEVPSDIWDYHEKLGFQIDLGAIADRYHVENIK